MSSPSCTRLAGTRFALEGPIGEYLRNVTEQWLVPLPAANPAILEMFADRDRLPARGLVPWAGEFAGKYLTGAMEVLRVREDAALRAVLDDFVANLVAMQAEDGYLGPWPRDYRLTNHAPNISLLNLETQDTWDAWGHYHLLLGLLLYHAETSSAQALQCATRIGDLLCDRYLGEVSPRLVETGSTEMNLATAHGLCLLYRTTGEPRYLHLAEQLVEEFAATDADGTPLAGDYLRGSLAGKAFYQLPRPRWESLHPIMTLVELSYLSERDDCREAFTRIWQTIADYDRHNNGGFSSGEQAQGNPYHRGSIETCCTIAWTALTVEMLRLTGDPRIADELELSFYNSIIGLHSPSGRWATYNTPMDGVRIASAQEIVFQSRAGSPELNCCSVNSARGFGLLGEWALLHDNEGLLLNLYAPGSMETTLPSGVTVTLRQETDYPRNGRIRLHVTPATPSEFTLKLRIPRWSRQTTVTVNGQAEMAVCAGGYHALTRNWQTGDVVEISLDMSLHAWEGAQECAGLTSLYTGPVLLTYDRRFNTMDPDDVPTLDAAHLAYEPVTRAERTPPILLWSVTAEDGRTVLLCDFGSAGDGGTPYRSWLPVRNAATLPHYFAPESIPSHV